MKGITTAMTDDSTQAQQEEPQPMREMTDEEKEILQLRRARAEAQEQAELNKAVNTHLNQRVVTLRMAANTMGEQIKALAVENEALKKRKRPKDRQPKTEAKSTKSLKSVK